MEKPMSTDINHAIELYKMVKNHKGESKFWVNHSANYRVQAKMAREVILSGKLGRIRHITAFFASPLKWIFEDPALKGWNEPTDGMLGNGFAWGQSSHLFAYLYHICPHLQPVDVFCTMTHSEKTGADVSHSATIRCSDGKEKEYVVMSVSGTSLLPGNAHSHPPIAKKVQIEVFGDTGSLHYEGNDRDPSSGRLEVRNPDGGIEVLHAQFHFENLDCEGSGPESLQSFVHLCCGTSDVYAGADVVDGLRSIQTIDAMYRSHASHQLENILLPE
jgi:predicted dehydrogenase